MEKLYIIDIKTLPDPKENQDILEGLPSERITKCLRLKNIDDRKRSLGAGIITRKLTKGQPVLFSDNGKPLSEGIFFNIAHSGDYVIGISSNYPIGCDIEKIKSAPLNVADKYFSPHEQKHINNSKNKDIAFFRLWTLKESFFKMTGEGLSGGINQLEVLTNGSVSAIKNTDCSFKTFIYNNHIISICCREKLYCQIEEINVDF